MAEQTSTPATPATPARKFKTKKALTLPTFKFETERTVNILILGPMHRGKQRGKPRLRADGTPEEPPILAHVVNLDTGEHGQVMCASIIETEIGEAYPDDDYIGRAFSITKQKRKEGKRYDPYNIVEIDLEDDSFKEEIDKARKEATAEKAKQKASAETKASADKKK